MHTLIKFVIILIFVATIFQISGGAINAVKKGEFTLNIFNYDLRITSEHLWWDSLFLTEIAIILTIIYSINPRHT